MGKKLGKFIVLILVAGLIFAIFKFDLLNYLSLDKLKSYQDELNSYYTEKPLLTIVIFMSIYIAATALSLPGATILTLAGGAVFGLIYGSIVVSFASTIGATLAFLAARYILGDSIQEKYKDRLQAINKGIEKEGALYLFTIRLIPAIPFFVINLLMGITKMPVAKYYFISQIGMLPATLVYVNAGSEISKIDSLSGILSPALIFSFVLLGLFPIITKKILAGIKARKSYANFKKPKTFEYNIISIGAGSAGLVTSYIGAAVKAKVLLIEKHKMGGDCLNTGCVPSKAILRSAKVKYMADNAQKYGLNPMKADFDFKNIMKRIHNVIAKIEPHDSVERYTDLGVDCIQGEAKILSPWEVEVNGKTITTKNIVIATGASPIVPDFPGIDKIKYVTSENLWQITEQPKRLVVLGGGPIGCEMAQSFQRLGSQVILVDQSARIMPREDEDVSAVVQEKFINEGMQLHLKHEIKSFSVENQQQFLICQHNNMEVKIPFDLCLVALGRKANTKGFGLEALQLELTPNNTIAVNEKLQTTKYPNVYACGDVAGPFQFTHTASHQAWYCAVNALFGKFKSFNVDYKVIPWATFTDPEVGRVGISENDAKEKEIEYRVIKYGLDDLDRAIADSADYGFVKVITPKESDKILGAAIVGQSGGDLIAEFVLAMKYNLGLNKILGTIHLYPSNPEALKYAAGIWKKETAPVHLYPYLEKFHRFMRS